MRSTVIALSLCVCPMLATAGPTGGNGNGGGGGRLGQTSGGLRNPPSPPRPPGNGGGGGGYNGGGRAPTTDDERNDGRVTRPLAPVIVATAAPTVVIVDGERVAPSRVRDPGTARIEAYAGAQKVHESQGAWHVELGVRDRMFRLRGQITRYYEEQPGGANLTLTMPALLAGIRIDERGPTRIFFEGGVVNAHTNGDPVEDTSYTGGLAGFRLEHRVARRTNLIGEAHEMFLGKGVRAHSARVGIKIDALQASIRVLDFNVGPPLYGPEIGLAF